MAFHVKGSQGLGHTYREDFPDTVHGIAISYCSNEYRDRVTAAGPSAADETSRQYEIGRTKSKDPEKQKHRIFNGKVQNDRQDVYHQMESRGFRVYKDLFCLISAPTYWPSKAVGGAGLTGFRRAQFAVHGFVTRRSSVNPRTVNDPYCPSHTISVHDIEYPPKLLHYF